MKQYLLFLTILVSTLLSKAQVNDSKVLELIETQRYPELASYLESVFPHGTDDSKNLNRLAYAYYMGGNLLKAESNYQKLLVQDTTKISTLNSLANVASKRGNYLDVIKYYQKILNLDSTNFYITKQIAYAYQQMDKAEEAFNYQKKANNLNPEDADIAFDYSKSLMYKLKLGKADTVLQIALKADSLNLLLLRGLLSINNASANFRAVVNTGEKLFSLGDSTNETKNKVAQAYYYTNKPEKCVELMSQLVRDLVANETTFYFLGLSYRKLNDIENSNDNFNRAIVDGISNNLGIYYQELGRNREELKQFSTSIYDYKKAMEFSEKINIANYSIARIYDSELKKPQVAITYYQAYLKGADSKSKADIPYITYSKARVKEITLAK